MLYLVPWVIAWWLRLERRHAAQVNASRRLETALRGIPAPRMGGDSPCYDRTAYAEQYTGNLKHDNRVRRLKVAALHEFKREFARRPFRRA